MKTAMDYIRERDERVDRAGKTERLKDWCSRFFDDRNWELRNGVTRLVPFHGYSGVWVEIGLSETKATVDVRYDLPDSEQGNVEFQEYWPALDVDEFTARVEQAWAEAVERAVTIPQVYFDTRIPYGTPAEVAAAE